MYSYTTKENLLPVMPGIRLYYVDRDSYEIDDDDTADGVAVFENELCVIVSGDICSLGGPYFLSREDAQEWIDRNRKPTLYELLDTAEWMSEPPSDSRFCSIHTIGGETRRAYYDAEEECFVSHKGSYHVISDVVSWTDAPVVEKAEW